MARTTRSKRRPPELHEDQGKAVYSIVCIDEQNQRHTVWFSVDLTQMQPLLNAMLLAGVSERRLKGTPFTAHVRRLTDGNEGLLPEGLLP